MRDRASWLGRVASIGNLASAKPASLALLVASALAVPSHASWAGGLDVVIPANAPSLLSFRAAAIGTNEQGYATYFGLVPLSDPSGNVLTEATPSGVGATAYLDPVGNVIVAYAWDDSPAENVLAGTVSNGLDPSTVPGYADAVAFLKTVQAAALAEGIPSSRIYLSGFSLGATLASYVGLRTGLPGLGFAACGIPGYTAPARPVDNFINFIEANDPIANFGTDTLEASSVALSNPHQDHYGNVVVLGSENPEEAAFASGISGYTLPQFYAGSLPLPPDQIATLGREYSDLVSANHQMDLYNPDTDAFARSYGIDPTAP